MTGPPVPGPTDGPEIRITSNTCGTVGTVEVGVSGVLPVREPSGIVRSRARLHIGGAKIEVFVGDTLDIGGIDHEVDIVLQPPTVVLTPCA